MPHIPVTMRYAEYVDRGSNSSKFYATFVIDRFYFFQWGRIGTDGQVSKSTSVGGTYRAVREAGEKLDSKLAEGYQLIAQVDLTVDLSGFTGDKPELQAIARAAHDKRKRNVSPLGGAPAAPAPTPATPVQPAAPTTADQLTAFHEQALATMGLAVTDPNAALVRYAVLRDEWETLQTQMDRARSYLDTLDQLLIGAVA